MRKLPLESLSRQAYAWVLSLNIWYHPETGHWEVTMVAFFFSLTLRTVNSLVHFSTSRFIRPKSPMMPLLVQDSGILPDSCPTHWISFGSFRPFQCQCRIFLRWSHRQHRNAVHLARRWWLSNSSWLPPCTNGTRNLKSSVWGEIEPSVIPKWIFSRYRKLPSVKPRIAFFLTKTQLISPLSSFFINQKFIRFDVTISFS